MTAKLNKVGGEIEREALIDRMRRFKVSDEPPALVVEGKIIRMVGMMLEAVGCKVAVGGRCRIMLNDTQSVEAEVVGFSGEKAYLMALDSMIGVNAGARERV